MVSTAVIVMVYLRRRRARAAYHPTDSDNELDTVLDGRAAGALVEQPGHSQTSGEIRQPAVSSQLASEARLAPGGTLSLQHHTFRAEPDAEAADAWREPGDEAGSVAYDNPFFVHAHRLHADAAHDQPDAQLPSRVDLASRPGDDLAEDGAGLHQDEWGDIDEWGDVLRTPEQHPFLV